MKEEYEEKSRRAMLQARSIIETLLFVAFSLPVLEGCAASLENRTAAPEYEEFRNAALELKPALSSKQVDTLLGAPTRIESGTCGQDTAEPWSCRIWEYGTFDDWYDHGRPKLRIYFQCAKYSKLQLAIEAYSRRLITEDELKAIANNPTSSEPVEEVCLVNSWHWRP